MSTMMVYLVSLVLGIVILIAGKLLENKLRIVLFFIGAVLAVFGGYGVFTALL